MEEAVNRIALRCAPSQVTRVRVVRDEEEDEEEQDEDMDEEVVLLRSAWGKCGRALIYCNLTLISVAVGAVYFTFIASF